MYLTLGNISSPPPPPQASSGQSDTPTVEASFDDIPRTPGRPLLVKGANFDPDYSELFFYPPLPEEAIVEYQVGGRVSSCLLPVQAVCLVATFYGRRQCSSRMNIDQPVWRDLTRLHCCCRSCGRFEVQIPSQSFWIGAISSLDRSRWSRSTLSRAWFISTPRTEASWSP